MNTQHQMYEQSRQGMFDKYRTFNDIQTGPNPLTPEEVRRLIDKHPGRYGFLEKWATPKDESPK